MPEPLTCAGLASAVVAQPLPVVFLDTAAILDVLRVPFRPELQADILNSADSIASDALTNPRRIWLITTANVIRELGIRRENVETELTDQIRSLQLTISRVLPAARKTFPDRHFTWPDLLELGFPQRIVGILDHLINSIVVFSGTAECIANARNRVWAADAPASRAKQEFKDCEIFEEFLEFASAIRRDGFEGPTVFVTPNSRDYGAPPNGHPRIASDLAALDARYVANVSWARALISL